MTAADRDSHRWRNGLLVDLTRIVIEAALEAELVEHLGRAKHAAGPAVGNARNGSRRKTVHTAFGSVTIDAPRDRWGTFDPATVGKWQRRVNGIDQLVVPLAARGADPAEGAALLSRLYGPAGSANLSDLIISEIGRRVVPWQHRRLDPAHRAILLDRVVVRSRDRRVTATPVRTAVGLRAAGGSELLALHTSPDSPSPESWFAILADLRGRGLADVDTVLCDPGAGVVDQIIAVWPEAVVYTRSATDGPQRESRSGVGDNAQPHDDDVDQGLHA